MKTDTFWEQLVHSPKLGLYAQEINVILQQEQKQRQEFYNQITEQDKAEFINGDVVVHSPVRLEHNTAGELLLRLLSVFVDQYDLGYVGYEKILISLTRNDYEPDICFFSKAKSSQFLSGQTRFPAPDLIVEILSASTEERDRGIKFTDYAAHGVQEYWLVDPDKQMVEQYVLQAGQYELRVKSSSGNLESIAVENFQIPICAIFDPAENLNTLRQLLLPRSG